MRGDGRTARAYIERLNLRAAVLAPVARGDQVLGVLKLQSSKPGAFSARDLDAVRLFAGVATAGLTEVRDITNQRAAGEALARSEERYRALFNAIDDGFYIIEFIDGPHGQLSDYVHVEANPGYERHTGIPHIIGRTFRDLAPAEADGWIELFDSVLRIGEPIRFEREFERVGRIFEVSAARIEPASRRQVSVLFRDITERKRSEIALRASEALAQENVHRVQLALAAGAITGTWVWDIKSDHFTADDAFAEAFGIDPELGRIGLSLKQVIATVHPDHKTGLIPRPDDPDSWVLPDAALV